MLRNIKLKNFKCFEQLDLDCRPLNLLCGLNGTGKSSVLQALLVLRQSFETGKLRDSELGDPLPRPAGQLIYPIPDDQLILNGERINIGTDSDVLFEGGVEYGVVGFALQDDGTAGDWERNFGFHEDSDMGSEVFHMHYSRYASNLIALLDKADGPAIAVIKRSIDRLKEDIYEEKVLEEKMDAAGIVVFPLFEKLTAERDGFDRLIASLDSTEMSSDDERLMIRRWLENLLSEGFHDGSICNWVKRLHNSPDVPLPLIHLVPADWRKVPPFGGRLVYVNAERVGPRKSYPRSDAKALANDFGANSEYAWSYLYSSRDHYVFDYEEDDPRLVTSEGVWTENVKIPRFIGSWLRDIVGSDVRLQLSEVASADAIIAGFLFDRPGGTRQGPYKATNVGFGLSYVLPVVLALLAEPGTLCLIENPESHLHPRGQTKLGELAARAAKAGVQVFVETHSDHFMDGVRIAVRDGLIKPEEVAFHYFERQGGKAVVSSPQVDADGRLSEWPAGFFDQHEENLMRLLAPRS